MFSTAVPLDPERLRHAQVVVGYSGGLDSSVLLHWLASSTGVCAGVRALHVHHGLHADADRWADHCRRNCERLGVPLRLARVEVPLGEGHGPEGAARHARHAAFARELGEGEVMALAHHRDDQAETFLLRALRASGPDGLKAMQPWRRFGNGWLWRPLLDVPRSQLLAYARAHALDWIEDPANADSSFDRNFLRHQVLPLLRERWPQADAAFARSARLCAQAVALLEQEDAAALAQVRTIDPATLSRSALRCIPQARRARVLRRWIDSLALPPLPANAIERIEAEVLDAAGDAEAQFAWHGAQVRAWRDLLHARLHVAPMPAGWHRDWDGAEPVVLPDGSQLLLEGATRLPRPLRVHARAGGERLVLPGRTHSHALKHVLQDLGVPPWVREHLPLLSDADGVLHAAADLVYSATLDAWLRAARARLVWRAPPGDPVQRPSAD